MIEFYEHLISRLKDRENQSFKMSINHCHARGIFSLVVDGAEHGKLTRVFIANKKLKPFDVQYHTHTYPITLTMIKGNVTHHMAKRRNISDKGYSVTLPEYTYRSFLNGGDGLTYVADDDFICSEYKLPIGSQVQLSENQFHTMSCSKGSMWIVEELGFEAKESRVLGVPFVLDGLYHEPAMFQINDNVQLVLLELKRLVEAHKLTRKGDAA